MPLASDAQLSLADWSWEPTVVLGLLALVALYVAAIRRGVIGPGDDTSPWFSSPRWRPVVFGLGVASALIALQSPIDTGGDEYLLSIHMVQHLILMMVSPPLALLGICGMGPPPPEAARRLRAAWTAVTRPWPATILFNVVLFVWHIPGLYNTTLTDQPLHILEHLTFVAVGVVFWWPIVDPIRGPGTRPVGSFAKIAMLGVAGAPPTILGFVLSLGGSPFYDFYAHAPRLWGLSPLGDQQVAGVIMFGIGNIIYFIAISIIFLRLFRAPEDDEAEIARSGAHPAG